MQNVLLAVQTLLVLILSTSLLAQGKITVDPNAPGSTPAAQEERKLDPRLDQKITYQVKLRQISDLTDDLTKLTGITLFAGSTKSDWRVREDCATVMAKDISLRDLMASIAHVMKFRWSRGGKAPNWTYRLVQDRAAIAEVERRIAERKGREVEKRQRYLDKMRAVKGMSADDLARLKQEDPLLCFVSKIGLLDNLVGFFEQAPSVKDSWLAGEPLKVSAARLPASAQQSLLSAARAFLQFGVDSGFGDVRNKEWFSAQLGELEKHGQEFVVEVSGSRPDSPIPSIQARAHGVGLDFMLGGPQYQRSLNRIAIQAYEEHRPVEEVQEEAEKHPEVHASDPTEPVFYSYSEEPLRHHSMDPFKSELLKEKVKSPTVTGFIAGLADKTGYAIVTDSFRGRNSYLDFEQGTKLCEVVDRMSNPVRNSNWNRSGQAIELWDPNWYDMRNARLSQAWLEAMRRKFREAGTLDIDDLAQIAMLTDAQFRKNIQGDDVLRHVGLPTYGPTHYRDWLKVYASLIPPQKLAILSDTGLAFADLNPDQQQSVIELVSSLSVTQLESLDLADLGARVTCTKETQGRRFVYTLRAFVHEIQIPGEYHFRTPLYVAPPKPRAAEQPKPSPLDSPAHNL